MSYTQPYSYHSAFFPPPGSSSSSSTTDDDSPPLATGDLTEDATEADDLPGLGGSWGAAVESRDTPGGRVDDCFLAGSVGGALRTKNSCNPGDSIFIFTMSLTFRHGRRWTPEWD